MHPHDTTDRNVTHQVKAGVSRLKDYVNTLGRTTNAAGQAEECMVQERRPPPPSTASSLTSRPGLQASFLRWADKHHAWNARSLRLLRCLETSPAWCPRVRWAPRTDAGGRPPVPASAFKVAALPGIRDCPSHPPPHPRLPKTSNPLSPGPYKRMEMGEVWFLKCP